MAAAVAELPPGFKLDELPPGFQLDAAPSRAIPRPIGVPEPPRPAPREYTIGEKIKGAVETAVELVSQFTGGAVGLAGGTLGGLAANIRHGDIGTQVGAQRVTEAGVEGAERGAGVVRNLLRSTPGVRLALGPNDGSPTSDLGQEALGAVGEVMGQAPALMAAPRGTVGMSPAQPMGMGPALNAVGTAVRAGADVVADAAIPRLNPNTLARAGTAVDANIPINAHQVTGNKFLKMLGEAAENVPMTGGASVRKARTENYSAGLARAIDPGTDVKVLNDQAFMQLQDAAGERIGEIAGRTDVPIESFADVVSVARRDTPDVQGVIATYAADLARIAEENGGKVPGDVLRKLRTEAQTQERGARASKGDLANAIQRFVKKIDEAVTEHAPQADVENLAEARRQYAVSKAIEPLVSAYPTGEFPPARLKAIITASKEGKRRMARGQSGELGDYARLGTEMLREAATSNTAERNLVFRAVTDAGAALKIGFVWPFATAYNLLGPRVVKSMVEAQRRRAAPVPDGPPPEPGLAQGFEDVPQGPGPAPQSPLGDLTPDWSTEPGAGAAARQEVVPTEGLVQAVDSPQGPARVMPGGYDPRPNRAGSGPAAPAPEQPTGLRPATEIPAVEGRPDLPDAMVVGAPAEAAATDATGAAMQTPDAALARRTQLAEVERVRAKAAESPEVAKILDEHTKAVEAKIKADAKKAQQLKDAEALRKAAGYTTDPELAARLRKRAEALEAPEKVPVGKVTEGNPPTPPVKEPKRPVPKGEATEVPVETIVAEDPSIPVGEAIEVVPDVVEAGGVPESADMTALRKKWPGLAGKPDAEVLAAEIWQQAQTRLMQAYGWKQTGRAAEEAIRDRVMGEMGGNVTPKTALEFNRRVTEAMDAEAQRLEAEANTPGTLANKRRAKQDEDRWRSIADHMHKADLEEIGLGVQEVRDLHRKGRITDADLQELSDINATSKDSHETATRLHQILSRKEVRGRQGTVAKGEAANAKFEVGVTYTDANGNKATYQADGTWKPVK